MDVKESTMKTQDIKNMAAAMQLVAENQQMANKKALAKAAASSEKGKAAVTLPKAPWDKDKSKMEMSSKEKMKKGLYNSKMDPVGQADADIDNDGDVDKSDKYLKNRRKAISKNINKDEVTTNPKLAKDKGSSGMEESSTWTVYNRILENRAAHIKGATEPMAADDGVSPNAKAMKKKMDAEKDVNDDDIKGASDDVAKAAQSGPSMKARSGDNKSGDKAVINKPEDVTKKGEG